jgi:hypothetical protein
MGLANLAMVHRVIAGILIPIALFANAAINLSVKQHALPPAVRTNLSAVDSSKSV